MTGFGGRTIDNAPVVQKFDSVDETGKQIRLVVLNRSSRNYREVDIRVDKNRKFKEAVKYYFYSGSILSLAGMRQLGKISHTSDEFEWGPQDYYENKYGYNAGWSKNAIQIGKDFLIVESDSKKPINPVERGEAILKYLEAAKPQK